jgi:protein-S-isoprenylcysteine O-methyltransferase Ste14
VFAPAGPPRALPRLFPSFFAWAGTLVFFVSLAYFLFSYATTFGIAAPDGGLAAPVTWNVVLFTVFAMHHSVFARERVRAWVAQIFSSGLERSFYVWVASLLFIGVCALWRPVPGVAWAADGAMLWVLRLLQAIGVWLTLRSAAILDVLELSGVRQARAAAGGAPAAAMEFKTTGPYGWVRHPIYTGWFLMVLAASPMTMTRLVFAVVSCAYLVAAIPFEERSMRAASAGAYDAYASKVPWKLVPRLFVIVFLGQAL